MRTSKVFIISGLPGAGKTHYTKWLEAHGWGRLSIDEVGESDQDFNEARIGNDEPLMVRVSQYPGFVIEWGFVPANLPQLSRMFARGYRGWYFDGDRTAALKGWKIEHPDLEDQIWHEQVGRLDTANQDIVSLYGSRIVVTVMPGPTYLTEEKITGTIGIAM